MTILGVSYYPSISLGRVEEILNRQQGTMLTAGRAYSGSVITPPQVSHYLI